MRRVVHRYLNVIVLSAALTVPVALRSREPDPQDSRRDPPAVRYEDTAHKDFHEWNADEERAYRRYLEEHHKKYRDFKKANKKEQEDYWNWRHSHPDDRH